MDIRLIVLIVFITGMIIMAITYRKATLANISLLPEESILMEEKGLKVEQAGAPGSAVFPGCIVRVTNQRIIIAQKAAFRKEMYVMRHLITYGERSDNTDLGATLKTGYLIFRIQKSDILIEADSHGDRIRIGIPESTLTRGQYITYRTKRASDYRKIFGYQV